MVALKRSPFAALAAALLLVTGASAACNPGANFDEVTGQRCPAALGLGRKERAVVQKPSISTAVRMHACY